MTHNFCYTGTGCQLARHHEITIQFRWIIKVTPTPECLFCHPATPTASHYFVATPSSIHGRCHSSSWCDCWWIPVSRSQKINTNLTLWHCQAASSRNVDFMRRHLFSQTVDSDQIGIFLLTVPSTFAPRFPRRFFLIKQVALVVKLNPVVLTWLTPCRVGEWRPNWICG